MIIILPPAAFHWQSESLYLAVAWNKSNNLNSWQQKSFKTRQFRKRRRIVGHAFKHSVRMTQHSPSSQSAPDWNQRLDCFHVRATSYPITEFLPRRNQRAAQSVVKWVSWTIFPTETCCHCFTATAEDRDVAGFAVSPSAWQRCSVTRRVAGPAHGGNE